TKVVNKFWDTREKDADTLTPIAKAIGMDLSGGLSLANRNNVLVEGITDYYYLQALRMLVRPEPSDFSFIPCPGITRIDQISLILYGWGLRFLVVMDGDGAETSKDLQKSLSLDDDQIILVPPNAGGDATIEDMFTWDDFNKYVLSAVGL